MTDDSMNFDSHNAESAPNDAEIIRRVARWSSQRAELATLISPNTDYSRLTWNILTRIGDPGVNEELMLDRECAVARHILDWLNANPAGRRGFRAAITSLPYTCLPDTDTTQHLRLHLWHSIDAKRWLPSREASSHDAPLWQFALMRLSAYLHTGSFTLNTPAQQR
jgi:hypothetical protein